MLLQNSTNFATKMWYYVEGCKWENPLKYKGTITILYWEVLKMDFTKIESNLNYKAHK